MRVGVLGSGQVGQALGRGFVEHGHEAMLGSRSPEKLDDWVGDVGDGASAGSFAEAAEFGELTVLATLGAAATDAIELAGPERLDGKTLIDATNPLDFSGDGPPQLFVGRDDSLGERVQRAAPGARVVKCFNVVGNAHMVDPDFPGGPPTMFIAGNQDEAKREVESVLDEFGWESIDLGGIEASRYLEPMCLVWVLHGVCVGSWDHAFKLLQR